jgi:hypothetical protein
VGKNYFDASIGLAFSLMTFERYRKNGLLQAELDHVPGIRGKCKGYLQIVEGKVTSCFIEDKSGRRYQTEKNMLIRLDNERGPFEWTLQPLPAPPSSTPQANTASQPASSAPTPQVIARLDLNTLRGWTPQQQLILSAVFDVIDGRRSIEEIKMAVPLLPHVVEEALRVLLALKVIRIVQS